MIRSNLSRGLGEFKNVDRGMEGEEGGEEWEAGDVRLFISGDVCLLRLA